MIILYRTKWDVLIKRNYVLIGLFLLTFSAVSQEETISSKKSGFELNDSSIVYMTTDEFLAPVKNVEKHNVVKTSWRGGCTYYGASHHGNKTASGKIFDKNGFTCASAKKAPDGAILSFGTKVKVTNLDNGKSVIVKITDRGKFSKKRPRDMDLSLGAFKKIASIKTGRLKNVKFEIL